MLIMKVFQDQSEVKGAVPESWWKIVGRASICSIEDIYGNKILLK